MATHLADLDELVLLCRTEAARDYIREAVLCYRAGAFRSAIISTWIAVVYDVIEKLRALALDGDKNAESEVERFEGIHAKADTRQALEFERNLLADCVKRFELLTPTELEDLERLQSDRNRCAHPNLIRYGEVYTPTAELARNHLRNAVDHVLRQAPKVGKAALERLFSEVRSDYFPVDVNSAAEVLKRGPLENPKESLIRDFTFGLVTAALKGDLPKGEVAKRFSAIGAVAKLHRGTFLKMLKPHAEKALSKTPDQGLKFLPVLLNVQPDLLEAVDGGLKARIIRCIEASDTGDLAIIIPWSLKLPAEFREASERRVSQLDEDALLKLVGALRERTPALVIDRVLDSYSAAGSFATANFMGKELVLPCLPSFSKEQLRKLFSIAKANGQIRASGTFETIVRRIQSGSALTKSEFEAEMRAREWDQFYEESEDFPDEL